LRVASIASLDLIEVNWNTAFDELSLPNDVQVNLNNGEMTRLNVAWQESSFEPLVAGVYSLIGTLTLTEEITNPEQVEAGLMVLIGDKPQPQDILLNITNRDRNPTIPIGDLSTIDSADDIHQYELTSNGPDNSFFLIAGNRLSWDSSKKISGQKDFTIEVSSTDRAGNTITKTFTLSFLLPKIDDIEVFNIFSPNGDGANDTWGIPDLFEFDEVTINIVDRAGRIVFMTTDPKTRWDGTFEGNNLPAGTYIYVIATKNPKEMRSGTINLIIR